MCYDQVYSSPSHAALYGVGSKAAAGRWGKDDEYDEEYSVHSLHRIPSQSNIPNLKPNQNTHHHRENSQKDHSIFPENSSTDIRSSSSLSTSNPNNISMVHQHHRRNESIGSSFLNKDQDSYDESSFQALNLTKQKIQERAAAALIAAAVANGEENPDLESLLKEHLQQKGLNHEEDLSFNSRLQNILEVNDIYNNDNDSREAVTAMAMVMHKPI